MTHLKGLNYSFLQESFRGVKLQKNLSKKFWLKRFTECRKIGFEGCTVFPEPNFQSFTGQFSV
jgi:hypothetical protein